MGDHTETSDVAGAYSYWLETSHGNNFETELMVLAARGDSNEDGGPTDAYDRNSLSNCGFEKNIRSSSPFHSFLDKILDHLPLFTEI